MQKSISETVPINTQALSQARRVAETVTKKRVSDKQLIKVGLEMLSECLLLMAQALPVKSHTIDLAALKKKLSVG